MKHILGSGPIVMVALGVASCGSHSAGALGDDDAVAALRQDIQSNPLDDTGERSADAAATCTSIPAPTRASLPHVSSGGAQGEAIERAVGALLASQQPPIDEGTRSYRMQNLGCGDAQTPSMTGFACQFSVSIDGRAPVQIFTPRPSTLAKTLFLTLADAGADDCNDRGHGDFLRLVNVAIDIPSNAVEFDDSSNFGLLPPPNVRASGPEGAGVVDAMEAAGIDDCDPTHTVLILCGKTTGTLRCSRRFYELENVGGSELIPVCAAPRSDGDVELGATEALTLWDALIDAAAASGYVPPHGRIEDVNLLNAEHLTWDGTTLSFALTADHLTPPPGPGSESP